MSADLYPPLSLKAGSIRLLRLMPCDNETDPIRGEILEYSLRDTHKGSHPYEAVSYVWGDPKKTLPIYVHGHRLDVTTNLHAALTRLRDHTLERILWVDAICINQNDNDEKERQIPLMAMIYSNARCVLVWLGEEANGSGRALEDIRTAAGDNPKNMLAHSEEAVIDLLRRPWFERIWVRNSTLSSSKEGTNRPPQVVQEIASARFILIMCGNSEITGQAFCEGMNKLRISSDSHPGLHGLVRSAIYLIRGAAFRPRNGMDSSARLTLGELMDMYHSRKATILHDKIYALHGISLDSQTTKGLLPNYKLTWKELFHSLVKSLCGQVSVETWNERELAVIMGKGRVLGEVVSHEINSSRYDRQHVKIKFKDSARPSRYQRLWGCEWTLQASAKPILEGDLVCLLQGASTPIILRACKDYFKVVMIAVTLRRIVKTNVGRVERIGLPPPTGDFPREFLLIWNWENSYGELQKHKAYENEVEIESLLPNGSSSIPEKSTRLYNMAMILGGMKRFDEASRRLQETSHHDQRVSLNGHLHDLALMESFAMIHKENKEWEEAEKKLIQVLRTRTRLNRAHNPDTLITVANLASVYACQVSVSYLREFCMESMVNRIENDLWITEKEMVEVVESYDIELLKLLLDHYHDRVPITEEVVKVAAKEREEAMRLLLDRRGDDIRITAGVIQAARQNDTARDRVMKMLLEKGGDKVEITTQAVVEIAQHFDQETMILLLNRRLHDFEVTEEVVKAAAINENWGTKIMTLLIDHRGDEVQITKDIVETAVQNKGGVGIMKLLLDRAGDKVQITEEVVMAAVMNERSGEEMITLLLDRRYEDVEITEEIIHATAENHQLGNRIIKLLLDRKGDDIEITSKMAAQITEGFDEETMILLLSQRGNKFRITKEIVKAAGQNQCGTGVMNLLLEQKSDAVQITEEVVMAAVMNRSKGEAMLALLLDCRGNEVQVTKEIVKAVAGNAYGGVGMMKLLFDWAGDDVQITEEVVEAAARNMWSGQNLISLLLRRRYEDVRLTKEVIKAAVTNRHSGRDVTWMLLQEKADEVQITEETVKAAKSNSLRGKAILMILLNRRGGVKITAGAVAQIANLFDKEVMRALLDPTGNFNIKITEDVVRAAAENVQYGKGVMKVLLDQRGDEVQITKEIVEAAVKNMREGSRLMKLLLNRRSESIQITLEHIQAAANDTRHGEETIKLLLDQKCDNIKITADLAAQIAARFDAETTMLLLEQSRGDLEIIEAITSQIAKRSDKETITELLDQGDGDITITSEVVKAAAENERNGEEVMRILLDRVGDNFQVTEEILKAAAGNESAGPRLLMLLMSQRGYRDIQITEEIVQAALMNKRSGEEVLRLLLNRGFENEQITDNVVGSAGKNERTEGEYREVTAH